MIEKAAGEVVHDGDPGWTKNPLSERLLSVWPGLKIMLLK